MILVDTSVLIDFFKGTKSQGAQKFEGLLKENIPFGISSLIFLEILQGAASVKEYNLLSAYLSTQRFYNPKDHLLSYAQAAKVYMSCRKKGLTVRSTFDCLIAQTAMEHDLALLHNDRDFDMIRQVAPLKVF